ncbi:MAG: hypothetical protein AAGK78_05300, partial [Planctomycetota bacterium]
FDELPVRPVGDAVAVERERLDTRLALEALVGTLEPTGVFGSEQFSIRWDATVRGGGDFDLRTIKGQADELTDAPAPFSGVAGGLTFDADDVALPASVVTALQTLPNAAGIKFDFGARLDLNDGTGTRAEFGRGPATCR